MLGPWSERADTPMCKQGPDFGARSVLCVQVSRRKKELSRADIN